MIRRPLSRVAKEETRGTTKAHAKRGAVLNGFWFRGGLLAIVVKPATMARTLGFDPGASCPPPLKISRLRCVVRHLNPKNLAPDLPQRQRKVHDSNKACGSGSRRGWKSATEKLSSILGAKCDHRASLWRALYEMT